MKLLHHIPNQATSVHGFWKRSVLTNMKKDALKYMINRLWYVIFHITCHINPRRPYQPKGRRPEGGVTVGNAFILFTVLLLFIPPFLNLFHFILFLCVKAMWMHVHPWLCVVMPLRGCRKRYSHISDQNQVNMRLVNLKRMLHQILSPVNKAHHQKCLRRTSTTPLSRYRQTDPRMSAAG
jgi:hypothetical protein